MIGGGDFENVSAASHKSCLKLVKKNNLFAFDSLADLKYQRNGHSVCNVNDTHLVVSGTRVGKSNTCEIYSIKDNTWSDLPELNQGRYYHSSCCFNGTKVFVFCGVEPIFKKYIDSIEVLDTTIAN